MIPCSRNALARPWRKGRRQHACGRLPQQPENGHILLVIHLNPQAKTAGTPAHCSSNGRPAVCNGRPDSVLCNGAGGQVAGTAHVFTFLGPHRSAVCRSRDAVWGISPSHHRISPLCVMPLDISRAPPCPFPGPLNSFPFELGAITCHQAVVADEEKRPLQHCKSQRNEAHGAMSEALACSSITGCLHVARQRKR